MTKIDKLIALKKAFDEILDSFSKEEDDDEFFLYAKNLTESGNTFLLRNLGNVYDDNLEYQIQQVLFDYQKIKSEIEDLHAQNENLVKKEGELRELKNAKELLEARIKMATEGIPELTAENERLTASMELINKDKEEIERVHGANLATYKKHFEANDKIAKDLGEELEDISNAIKKLLFDYDSQLKSIISVKDSLPIERIAQKFQ